MEYISDLRAFLKVVEKQNFSGAAGALGMSQSAVSKRITRLETSLGVQLLKRSTRHLSLTDAGAEFHVHAERILIELDAAQRLTSAAQAAVGGRLRIHSTLGVGQSFMAPAIAEFVTLHPEISIDLVLAPSNAINLMQQDVDLTIRLANERETLVNHAGVDHQIVGTVRYLICATPAYFERAGVPETPQDLARHNCLVLSRPPSSNLWRFSGPKGDYTVRVSGNYTSNSGAALYHALLKGAGIAQMLEYAALEELAKGRLRNIFADVGRSERVILAYYARSPVPARTRIFLDFLTRYLSSKLDRSVAAAQ
ncbi:MAG TPA: LysR substrate-binding domain-containing protein [Alphaproteobacteria bacterium]|jgi:DNA-binding transcriptional LysR family regulator